MITLDSTGCHGCAADTLVHEWAHASHYERQRRGSARRGGDDHASAWGVEYARCYRASLRARWVDRKCDKV